MSSKSPSSSPSSLLFSIYRCFTSTLMPLPPPQLSRGTYSSHQRDRFPLPLLPPFRASCGLLWPSFIVFKTFRTAASNTDSRLLLPFPLFPSMRQTFSFPRRPPGPPSHSCGDKGWLNPVPPPSLNIVPFSLDPPRSS